MSTNKFINNLNKKGCFITLSICIAIILVITLGTSFNKRKVISRERHLVSVTRRNKDNTKDTTIKTENDSSHEKNSNSDSSSDVHQSSQVYKDGEYNGSAPGYNGDIKVKVSVKDGKINSIDILESSDDKEYFNKAKALVDKVIASQNTNVDSVSGATYSSNGILDAIQNALDSGV